MPERRKF